MRLALVGAFVRVEQACGGTASSGSLTWSTCPVPIPTPAPWTACASGSARSSYSWPTSPDSALEDSEAFHVSLDYTAVVKKTVGQASRPAAPGYDELARIVDERDALRAKVDELSLQLAERTAQAIECAQRLNLNLRDTADMLHLSHQRVDQIAKGRRTSTKDLNGPARGSKCASRCPSSWSSPQLVRAQGSARAARSRTARPQPRHR